MTDVAATDVKSNNIKWVWVAVFSDKGWWMRPWFCFILDFYSRLCLRASLSMFMTVGVSNSRLISQLLPSETLAQLAAHQSCCPLTLARGLLWITTDVSLSAFSPWGNRLRPPSFPPGWSQSTSITMTVIVSSVQPTLQSRGRHLILSIVPRCPF